MAGKAGKSFAVKARWWYLPGGERFLEVQPFKGGPWTTIRGSAMHKVGNRWKPGWRN